MRSTRKKVIKTVYKDENSDEDEGGDFSDSGSEAHISGASSSEEDDVVSDHSSGDEFDQKTNKNKTLGRKCPPKKTKFSKSFVSKINKQKSNEDESNDIPALQFSIKDMTEADKLLPPILNLSESDSSDDESPRTSNTSNINSFQASTQNTDSDNECTGEYKDVWSSNIQEQNDSEEIAKKTFMELEQHKSKVEEAKASLLNYTLKMQEKESDVKDLLALGEEIPSPEEPIVSKKPKFKKRKDDSDSEMEDWEEVKESKAIPQQGIQLFVEFPDAVARKSKKIDVEMMMRRKINRVKKEYQVYMHKVHVLCWIGHGNYINRVLNDQGVMAAALSLVPAKECYPGERVDMKYVEQITNWYKDKLTLKQDKNEDKFKPKAPPLKTILLDLIKKRVVTAKKYLVFIFVAMIRALGLQCRIMFNFVTLPLKPPTSELCSLSTKPKDETVDAKPQSKTEKNPKKESTKSSTYRTNTTAMIKNKKSEPNASTSKAKPTRQKIAQVDGNDDSCLSSDDENMEVDITYNQHSFYNYENIMQVDGNDDAPTTRKTRSTKRPNVNYSDKLEEEEVSPPKIAKKGAGRDVVKKRAARNSPKPPVKPDTQKDVDVVEKRTGRNSPKPPVKPDTEKNVDVVEKRSSRNSPKPPVKPDTEKDVDVVEKRTARNSPKPPVKPDIQKDVEVVEKRTGRNSPKPPVKPDTEKNVDVVEKRTGRNSPKPPVKPDIQKDVDVVEKRTGRNSPKPPVKPDTEKDVDVVKKRTGRNSPKPPFKPDADKDVDVVKKRAQRGKMAITTTDNNELNNDNSKIVSKEPPKASARSLKSSKSNDNESLEANSTDKTTASTTRSIGTKNSANDSNINDKKLSVPKIFVTDENKKDVASKYFEHTKPVEKTSRLSRKRSHTANPKTSKSNDKMEDKETTNKTKARTKSAPGTKVEKSRYFENDELKSNSPKRTVRKAKELEEDKLRVSHRDLAKSKKGKLDVTGDLVNIIKNRIKDAKTEAKNGLGKGKIKQESDEDSDYLPVEEPKRNSDSDDDFKPTKISPKPVANRRIDRRVLSTPTNEEPNKKNKIDVWCEIFVEELEQWISVDVIKGKIHSTGDLYNNATHPVCYVVGWDNNNYLKDLTRKYVPQYNTVTRKLRAEPLWWDKAIRPYLGPKTAREREEDEYLDKMQLEAPLPKSIAEYKNHPLYALKRHLLKFEAIYPPDAAVLGFVRGEEVYARECVYTCRSRDTWLKEAKVVKLGEKPYKIVKARPKWDKLSNKLITDKALEVFGPWQVQEYEPPVAEDGVVPRNAYGNVELFKECMLPKGTVHIKLPGLNRVAKKLNIDCAPAMTGFDFNGGWSHPVFDGFVVCQEFEEIVTDAWVKDQEEQERREKEKIELRVYGNWKRLIKGLMIRERLKLKYGFEEPTTSAVTKGKAKAPKFVAKKK